MLQIDRSFVCGDKACFGQQAQEEFRTYLDQRLPMEYELCFKGLKSILKESWRIESDSGQGIFCYEKRIRKKPDTDYEPENEDLATGDNPNNHKVLNLIFSLI